jgi:ribosomal protein S18 acetylase RimI-like enzyme
MGMTNTILIRQANINDEAFLWDILYEAISIPSGEEAPPPSILEDPAIARYLLDWGRKHDHGWIAEDIEHNQPLGAAWLRLWDDDTRGYGFFHPEYPELTIALLPEARGQGIGTRLMERLITEARDAGYPGISLSVSVQNPARHLYERLGFRIVSEDDESVVMVLEFGD